MKKKSAFALCGALILGALFSSASLMAAGETCTLEVGGTGTCQAYWLNGKVVGYWCDLKISSQITPCNH